MIRFAHGGVVGSELRGEFFNVRGVCIYLGDDVPVKIHCFAIKFDSPRASVIVLGLEMEKRLPHDRRFHLLIPIVITFYFTPCSIFSTRVK